MEEVTELYHPRFTYNNMSVANFIKKIDYTEENGEYILDSYMKVSVQFDNLGDFEHIKITKSGDKKPNRNPNEFIDELIDNIKEK